MNVKIKDENGEIREGVVQEITVSKQPVPNSGAVQNLTNQVQQLQSEMALVKAQNVTNGSIQSNPTLQPQQQTPMQQTVRSTRVATNNGSFLNALFGIVSSLASFTARSLFWVSKIVFGFFYTIFDMVMEILIAVDFTGILASLFGRDKR